MNENMLDEIRQRTFRYYYEDGLVEMAVGGLFALIGLSLFFYDRVLINGRYAWLLSIIIFALTAGGGYAVKAIILGLKKRVTYPRSGQVRYSEQPTGGRWLLLTIVAFVVLLGFFLPEGATPMPVMVAGLMAAILGFMGRRVGLRRMQLAAVFPVAMGILSFFLVPGEIIGVALVFVASGLALLIPGVVVLRAYLHNNPVRAKDTTE